ncbi:MAG: DUF4349 domain-containing protein [Omnitrophica WOR_2 bacterium]
MYKRILTLVSLIAILLASCSAAKMQAPSAPVVDSSNRGLSQPESAPANSQGGSGNVYQSQIPEVKRLVIKNDNLAIAVDNPAQSMDTISRMADEMGGFVVTAKVYQTSLASGAEVPEASITIRVPAERLDEAIARIKTETKRPILSETMESQDVTKDYTDLQSRLRNLETAEAQLKEIMGSAQKTEDVLNVYNQLTQVQGQIEVIKGQIQYYEQSAALSSIAVSLRANEAVQPLTVGGWQPGGVAKDALQATINAFKFMANAAIWIVLTVIPVLFFLFLPLYLLYLLVRFLRRSRRKSPPVTPAAAD